MKHNYTETHLTLTDSKLPKKNSHSASITLFGTSEKPESKSYLGFTLKSHHHHLQHHHRYHHHHHLQHHHRHHHHHHLHHMHKQRLSKEYSGWTLLRCITVTIVMIITIIIVNTIIITIIIVNTIIITIINASFEKNLQAVGLHCNARLFRLL